MDQKFSVGACSNPTTRMPNSSVRVTKIRITSPLTVFLKHGQLDVSKASDSISDSLTSIFPENFYTSWKKLDFVCVGHTA